MVEWHITPDYIVNNWTDELLNLMIEKLLERKKRETTAISPETTSNAVSVEELARRSRGFIEVKKNGD